MTQPTKREQLAAMRLEDFKAHLRTIAGEDPNAEISGAARPHPLLIGTSEWRERRNGGDDKGAAVTATFTIAAVAFLCSTAAAAPLVTYESPCECRDNHGKHR